MNPAGQFVLIFTAENKEKVVAKFVPDTMLIGLNATDPNWLVKVRKTSAETTTWTGRANGFVYEFHACAPNEFVIPIVYIWFVQLKTSAPRRRWNSSFRVTVIEFCRANLLKLGRPFFAPITSGIPYTMGSNGLLCDSDGGLVS